MKPGETRKLAVLREILFLQVGWLHGKMETDRDQPTLVLVDRIGEEAGYFEELSTLPLANCGRKLRFACVPIQGEQTAELFCRKSSLSVLKRLPVNNSPRVSCQR